MGVVPIVYRGQGNLTATYEFSDIASGAGYINFYAGKPSSGYMLSSSTFYSDVLYTGTSTNAADYTKIVDVDFDCLMNKPITLQGIGYVQVSYHYMNTNAAGDFYVIVRARKWNGASETELGLSTASAVKHAAVPGTDYTATAGCNMTIASAGIKSGEYLRLTVEGWARNTGGGGNTSYMDILHDPMGRTPGTLGWTSATPSTLIFQCPVRIDL